MLHPVPTAYNTPGGRVYDPFLDMASKSHLLIAGSTGSGKSVALNGIITCLLMTESPARCMFVLIDPKRVELIQYARFPHTARYAAEHPDIVEGMWKIIEASHSPVPCGNRKFEININYPE